MGRMYCMLVAMWLKWVPARILCCYRGVVPAQQRKQYTDRADIVIVGNGIAGLTAAVEARRLAPDKRIVMITEQVHPTINTPALKQFAIAKLEREQLLAYPAGTERR